MSPVLLLSASDLEEPFPKSDFHVMMMMMMCVCDVCVHFWCCWPVLVFVLLLFLSFFCFCPSFVLSFFCFVLFLWCVLSAVRVRCCPRHLHPLTHSLTHSLTQVRPPPHRVDRRRRNQFQRGGRSLLPEEGRKVAPQGTPASGTKKVDVLLHRALELEVYMAIRL